MAEKTKATEWVQTFVAVTSLLVVAVFSFGAYRQASASNALAEELASFERNRFAREREDAAITQFVSDFFVGACEDRVAMMSFPLKRYYSLEHVDQARVLSQCDAPATTELIVDEIDIRRSGTEGSFVVVLDIRFDADPSDSESPNRRHGQDGITYVEMHLSRCAGEADGTSLADCVAGTFEVTSMSEVIVRDA